LDDSPKKRRAIKIAQGEQTISERKFNNPLLTCVTRLCVAKRRNKQSTQERNLSKTKVYLGISSSQMKKDNALNT